MDALFNKRVLLSIPLLFLFVISLRIGFAYNKITEQQYEFAEQEAKVLNAYAMTHRVYYQKLFINKTITLNSKTLPALPAFSSAFISDSFSKNNTLGVSLQTVSDRARNKDNSADADELKAIEYFNRNTQATEYFSDENKEFYQYASALKVEKKCLVCHGPKEKAPLFIQERYDTAYDYKLGDLRGIMSIKIPVKGLDKYFFNHFLHSIVYDIFLLLTLFLAIYFLLKKSHKLNDYLSKTIQHKTQELQSQLIYDDLTKLPNRKKLILDMKDSQDSRTRHLALLNVDRFKDLNDFYGHEVGDEILKDITKIIQANCYHKSARIYKLPSDEFAIYVKKDITSKQFLAAIKNIMDTITKTKIEVQDHSIFVSMSCGIASNQVPLMAKADMALKLSKLNKRDVVVYTPEIDSSANITKNIDGVTLIKNSLERDNFQAFYQPIFNIHTQKIEKYEALVRIVQNDGSIITPYHFLDIAIKSKLYPDITKIMITKTFAFFEDKDYEFSLNLSIDDILNKQTVKFIIKSLKKFPQPNRVVFEILESDKIGNYEELKEFIKKVKQYGCKVAIDDFGSGYSNFSHILELNIDYLKIDASLVKYITTDENSRVITKTIINFASNLGLKTIAEFVEDKDSLEMLEKMGADYVQGYYIGKPDKDLNQDWN